MLESELSHLWRSQCSLLTNFGSGQQEQGCPALGKDIPKPQAALSTVSSSSFPVLPSVALLSQKLGRKFYRSYLYPPSWSVHKLTSAFLYHPAPARQFCSKLRGFCASEILHIALSFSLMVRVVFFFFSFLSHSCLMYNNSTLSEKFD